MRTRFKSKTKVKTKQNKKEYVQLRSLKPRSFLIKTLYEPCKKKENVRFLIIVVLLLSGKVFHTP